MKARYTGKVARIYRLQAEMTQGELSQKLGFRTSQFVSNWERGLASVPLKLSKKICKVLSIPSDELKAAHLREKIKEVNSHFKA